jgi:hypothetical protein
MNETNASWLTASGTSTINGYSGCTISTGTTINTNLGTVGMGCTNPSSILTVSNSNNMTPRQVKVAVFTIHRDPDTNEINSTKFVKELWVEKKNGTSLDLIVAKHLDATFDPENTIVREIYTVSF